MSRELGRSPHDSRRGTAGLSRCFFLSDCNEPVHQTHHNVSILLAVGEHRVSQFAGPDMRCFWINKFNKGALGGISTIFYATNPRER